MRLVIRNQYGTLVNDHGAEVEYSTRAAANRALTGQARQSARECRETYGPCTVTTTAGRVEVRRRSDGRLYERLTIDKRK